ncbi:MAG: regulatory signaling modulator protein AmpE [Pseudomonadota bacterium]
MKIIALFVALILERLTTHLFHWRELRWLDPLIDFGLRLSQKWSGRNPYLWLIAVLLIAVAPVLLARIAFHQTLLGLPYLILSVVVLFLSLGPQDIGEEVDRWRRAIDEDDRDAERNNARALLERGFNDVVAVRGDIPAAVFVQANNRMFAVIFWFVVFGPVGAWLYRVTDLIRRRALFQALRTLPVEVSASCGRTAYSLQALLAFIPARLSACGYILAGHYDAGRDAWRTIDSGSTIATGNERLLGTVGVAALQCVRTGDESDTAFVTRQARAAKNLVLRTLGFWLVGIALLTIAGVAV